MTEQCSAQVYVRAWRRFWRQCKYGALPGGTLCRYHTRVGTKPRPPRCQREVFTYSERGHHQCYLPSVESVDGQPFCRRHAMITRREQVAA